ncbi:MAG: DUF2505 domain-containing protein [Actinomycetaceae bacterium]|nr:DUF2505 domain-containing protein [Actinomycetaceae bacterium]
MKFQLAITYPGTLNDVTTMLTDQRFYKIRAELLGIKQCNFAQKDEGDTRQIRSVALIAENDFPENMKKFLPGQIALELTENWHLSDREHIHSEISVRTRSAPCSLNASCVLESKGNETTRTMDGEIKIAIPLFGRKIELAAAARIRQVSALEQAATKRYLDRIGGAITTHMAL